MKTENSGIPAATAEDYPDAPLFALEEEYFRLQARFDALPDDEIKTDPTLGEMSAILRMIGLTSANTLPGAVLKFRMLHQSVLHGGTTAEWHGRAWDSGIKSLTRIMGTAGPLADTRATAIDNPDAKLFALEVEMKAAHEGYATPKSDEDYWYARMNAAEKATLAISAKTPSDVAAKLRIFAHYQDPPRDDDEVFNNCMRNVIEDAQRIGGAS